MTYTFRDLAGSLLAFLLFIPVMLVPGYVSSWGLDLFEFRRRQPLARLVVSIVISIAVVPIVLFLAIRFGSSALAFLILTCLAIAFIVIVLRSESPGSAGKVSRLQTLALSFAAIWIGIVILSLVDIQWMNRLYFSVVSFDLTTRVAIVDAITRTGVPPINPGYYPGHPQPLSFLYYFWYIPVSLVDQLGGKWVDARMAMIAGDAWCGLGLIAVIALYLRLRNPSDGEQAWKTGLIGVGALTISGLDALPALAYMVSSRVRTGVMFPPGDIEHWNTQITAWMGALLWVPHHVAGLIACLAGFLLFQSVRGKSRPAQVRAMLVAGLAFASALGLSTWITAVFALFWASWLVSQFFSGERRQCVLMLLTGVVALIASGPYLAGLLRGGLAKTPFPVALEIRTFGPLVPLVSRFPSWLQSLAYLLVLPVNYSLELGFFFVIGLIWLDRKAGRALDANPFHTPEIILLSLSALVGSFVRSTLIYNNDLGWRSWMFGQFVLLVWAVDVLGETFATGRPSIMSSTTTRYSHLLRALLVLGVLTTVVDLTLLRTWPILVDTGIPGFPTDISPDNQLGRRTYDARMAYEFIRDNLPSDVIVQYNPARQIDRPSGLYGTRQMALADRTAYGVSATTFGFLQSEIGRIFQGQDQTWLAIDQDCHEHSIGVVIVNDTDPLWRLLPMLVQSRLALYQNDHYAIFSCGALQTSGQ